VLKFEIAEGPPVEVARIDFSGNDYFSNKDLEGEVLAFVKEQMESEDVFQSLNTETVDDLGISDKRPSDSERHRGAKSPRHKRARVYVPKIYGQAMDHLATIYQEQGFLGVHVKDTCDITERTPLKFRDMRFQPIVIFRPDDSAEDKEGSKRPCVFINEERDMFIVAVSIEEGSQTRLNEIAGNHHRRSWNSTRAMATCSHRLCSTSRSLKIWREPKWSCI
jgi:hypothetical protein